MVIFSVFHVSTIHHRVITQQVPYTKAVTSPGNSHNSAVWEKAAQRFEGKNQSSIEKATFYIFLPIFTLLFTDHRDYK